MAERPGADPGSDPGADLARAALARARSVARSRSGESTTSAASGSERARPRMRGEELRSGPGADARDPQPLGRSLRRLLRERGWEQQAAAGGLAVRWAEVVGPDVAAHVRPEAFDVDSDARLVLRADSTAWATQVRLLLPDLRRRIDAAVGPGVVRDIAVLGPAAPSWVAGPRRVRGRGPRDTYG